MLINALLTLSYCFLSQQTNIPNLECPHSLGNAFFREARQYFDAKNDHYSKTTIQALVIIFNIASTINIKPLLLPVGRTITNRVFFVAISHIAFSYYTD